jgi:eukaryotic-like serine/threonine-protein kinase
MIGTRIGSYEIKKQLGQGGMGAVYLAEHGRIGNRKVVKVLLPEYSQNEQIVRRFENEAHAAARLNHRNIIKIDDFGRLDGGQWYILMPFLEGSPLDDFLASHGKLSIHDALHILVQIASALHEAHRLGIVHRDLKPGNVFLTQVGDNARFAMLLDFGIAKVGGLAEGSHTQTGAVFGTPVYMAAEQFEDASRADARSDLFALGVIAYQMVTGELPFGSAAGPVLYNRQITSRPEPPAGVPKAWADILLRTLSLRPDMRPASARAFAIALASATPEDPPYDPSGAEILALVARELVTQAPAEEATVKNNASADRVAPMLWGAVRTGGGSASSAHPSSGAEAPAVSAPTVVLRPAAPVQHLAAPSGEVTTLSAMAGAQRLPAQAPPTAKRRRWLGGASVALLGMVSTAGWMLRARPEEHPLAATKEITSAAAPAAARTLPSPEAGASGAPSAMGESPGGTTTTDRASSGVATAASPATVEITIETVPPGAALTVDGRDVGQTPQVVTATLGNELQIRAALPGRSPAVRTLRVAASTTNLTLRLERIPRPAKGPKATEKPREMPTDDIEEGR